ncbi:MAG: hypothetical protein WBF47_26330 [Xanthobacteraceae bacterium]
MLERASGYLTKTSDLAQQAPAEMRGEFVAFEREAAMASTADAMTKTPPEILKSSAIRAELADRRSRGMTRVDSSSNCSAKVARAGREY